MIPAFRAVRPALGRAGGVLGAMTTTASLVRPLRRSEVPILAGNLASAMAEDPFVAWLSRGEQARARAFLRLGIERLALRHGEVLVTADLSGGVLLIRPGALPVAPQENLAMLPQLVGSVGFTRVTTVLRALMRLEGAHPPEPHWTGLVLGVDPRRQGRGRGRALIEAALDRVDRERLPAYLEACSDRQLDLYRRCGFVVRERVELPGGGPTMAVMWREAQG